MDEEIFPWEVGVKERSITRAEWEDALGEGVVGWGVELELEDDDDDDEEESEARIDCAADYCHDCRRIGIHL